jgi:reactive intermediate/imine deaminase
MNNHSRRTFLRALSGAPAAAGVLGVAGLAAAEDKKPGKRIVPGSVSPNYSKAVAADRLVFVSGVLGIKPGAREVVSPDFEAQCRQTLENLKASVEASGATLAQVVKCTCFLTDAADFATFNRVYVTFFPSDPPARSTVVVKELVAPGAKVEVDCFVYL